jgi:autotransporter-associated beta strand protein
MTISGSATSDGSCSGGAWTPTADGANLDVADIASCVSSGSITIGDSGSIDVEAWPSSLPDSVTLDGNSTIDVPTPTGVDTSITDLTVDGTATIGTTITTDGDQLYMAPVDLNGDAIFDSGPGDVTFDSTIDGAHALTVSSSGTDLFAGAIGSTAPPTTITTTAGGPGAQLGGNVTTTGTQEFAGNVALEHNITFNAGGSTVTLGGVVSGAGQLTVSGGGTAELTNFDNPSDSYSGGTVVSGDSTLDFDAGVLGTGPVALNNGTLTWSGANTSDISSKLQIGSGGGTLDTNGNDATFANSFGGGGPLTKTGAGTLTLNAASGSYGNEVVVNQGTVLVPASKSVTTPVLIDSGGALNCDGGTLSGGVTNDGGTATGAPDAPTSVTASPGFENATLSFTAGTANCYPLSYTVSGGGLSWSPSSSPATLSGLSGSHAYTFTITATNPIGSASASSNQIIAEPYDPAVSISSPVNGVAYAYGQKVDAGYSCQDGTGGLGIQSCTGPAASGSALSTTAPGQHTFTVTATSLDGLTASTSVTYTVLAPANSFKVKSVKASRNGTITVSLSSLPDPGTVIVTERAANVPPFSVRKKVGSKPTLTFSVPASEWLKARLKHQGIAVKLRIAYTPANGTTRRVVTSIHLK